MNQLSLVIERTDEALKQIRDAGISPSHTKELERRFNATELGPMVGRSSTYATRALAKIVEEGGCPPFKDETRFKYEMSHVKALRDAFDTNPYRDEEIDEPVVMAVQNFKGGVGKTTVSLNVAQYLALKGYRVLFMDLDSQASATEIFGYLPDVDLDDADTLIPFFDGEEDTLDYCIRKTYWPGLDLVPTNLSTFSMEWGLAKELLSDPTPEDREYWTTRLKYAIDSAATNYDVVIIDSPPSLGVTSMNILRAVNAVLIPVPAKMLDFASTSKYLHMLQKAANSFPDGAVDLKFVSLATTLYEGRDNASKEVRAISDEPVSPNTQMQFRMLMEEIFGDEGMLIAPTFKKAAEVENAASSYATVLEEKRPQKAALEMIENFCAYIELQILRCWPSKAKAALQLEKSLGAKPESKNG